MIQDNLDGIPAEKYSEMEDIVKNCIGLAYAGTCSPDFYDIDILLVTLSRWFGHCTYKWELLEFCTDIVNG
jgi:hypothetical protein